MEDAVEEHVQAAEVSRVFSNQQWTQHALDGGHHPRPAFFRKRWHGVGLSQPYQTLVREDLHEDGVRVGDGPVLPGQYVGDF